MTEFIPVPRAALGVAGRSREARYAVLDLFERGYAAGWAWMLWDERSEAEAWGMSRKAAVALLGMLERAGFILIERSAPRSGLKSSIRVLRPTKEAVSQRANQDANQDANQGDQPETPDTSPPEPGREPEREPLTRVVSIVTSAERREEDVEQLPLGRTTHRTPAAGPPPGWLEAVAIWKEHRPGGVDLSHTRGEGKVLAGAIRGYGADHIHRAMLWVFLGPDEWARKQKLGISNLFRPSNVEGTIEKSAGWEPPARRHLSAEDAARQREEQLRRDEEELRQERAAKLAKGGAR